MAYYYTTDRCKRLPTTKKLKPSAQLPVDGSREVCVEQLKEIRASQERMVILRGRARKAGASASLCNNEKRLRQGWKAAARLAAKGDAYAANDLLRRISKDHIGYHSCLERHGIHIKFRREHSRPRR